MPGRQGATELIIQELWARAVHGDRSDDEKCGLMLHRAIESGHAGALQWLFAMGADPDWTDCQYEGSTPLFAAALQGDEASMQALLDAGAALDVKEAKAGLSPLTVAAGRPDGKGDACVRLLLSAGVNTEAGDFNELTTLMWAISRGAEKSTLRLLLAAGADVEARGAHGLTALMIAAILDNEGALAVLLEGGASKEAHGVTALSFASNKGHHSCVQLLS